MYILYIYIHINMICLCHLFSSIMNSGIWMNIDGYIKKKNMKSIKVERSSSGKIDCTDKNSTVVDGRQRTNYLRLPCLVLYCHHVNFFLSFFLYLFFALFVVFVFFCFLSSIFILSVYYLLVYI